MSVIKEAEKILVIDLLYLGDLTFATPFIRNLRKCYPEAQLEMVVNADFAEIIEDNPYLDQVHAYNKDWSIIKSWKFARRLSNNNYQLGINIHGNWRTALLLKVINPDYSVGFGTKGRGIFLDESFAPLEGVHMVEVYLDVLKKMGFTNLDEEGLELGVNPQAEEKMKEFLSRAGINNQDKIIALNTGGSWPTKRWPKEKFARLADRLEEEAEVIFLGGPGDVDRVEEITDMMESEPIIAAGKTSLKELAALVSLCDLVISTDSGPVHVAASVGTDTLTLFGPSDETKFKPYGKNHQIVTADVDCRPCGEHECPKEHHNCMRELSVKIIDNGKLTIDN